MSQRKSNSAEYIGRFYHVEPSADERGKYEWRDANPSRWRDLRDDSSTLPDSYLPSTQPAKSDFAEKLLAAVAQHQDSKLAEFTTLVTFLKKRGFRYVDLRDRGGCLWVMASNEAFAEHRDLLARKGVYFQFAPSGGKAIGYQPGWWTKSPE